MKLFVWQYYLPVSFLRFHIINNKAWRIGVKNECRQQEMHFCYKPNQLSSLYSVTPLQWT